MPKFNIRTDYLRAVASCVSTEETRYYLKGVYVQPCENKPGVYLVATDGHRMGVAYDPEGYAECPAILSMDWKQKEMKAKRGDQSPRFLKIDNESAAICVFDTGYEFTLVNRQAQGTSNTEGFMKVSEVCGTFPDWRRVLPNMAGDDFGVSLENVGLNGKYMADAVSAAAIVSPDKHPFLKTTMNGAGPALVRISKQDNVFFIIMPVRFHHNNVDVQSLPDWLEDYQGFTERDEDAA